MNNFIIKFCDFLCNTFAGMSVNDVLAQVQDFGMLGIIVTYTCMFVWFYVLIRLITLIVSLISKFVKGVLS